MGPARISAKERAKKERQVRREKKRKGIEVQRVKHPTPSRAINGLIGDEKQYGKQKKETESGTPTQLPWAIWSPPTTCRDHTVSLFGLQGGNIIYDMLW